MNRTDLLLATVPAVSCTDLLSTATAESDLAAHATDSIIDHQFIESSAHIEQPIMSQTSGNEISFMVSDSEPE